MGRIISDILMKERHLTGKIGKAMRDDARFRTCAVEVKITKTKSFPVSRLQPHQRTALLGAESGGGIYHKLRDMSAMGAFWGAALPFDLFVMKEAQAWLVIVYGGITRPMEAWAIQIGDVPLKGGIKLERARIIGRRVY